MKMGQNGTTFKYTGAQNSKLRKGTVYYTRIKFLPPSAGLDPQ